jgi:hypothetical protein
MAQSDHSPDPDAGAVDDGSTALATVGEKRPWRGDEHKLQVESAKEAGLPANEVELELFTEGFKAGMTLDDPADKAIVLRPPPSTRPRSPSKCGSGSGSSGSWRCSGFNRRRPSSGVSA